jgi:chlorobactene glucosyltransferase
MPFGREFLYAAPWILFALALGLLNRKRPRLRDYSPPPPEESPRVSIIVPARDEAENISACLATLLASCYENREIIVVDDSSVDGTADIARILESRSNGDLRLVVSEPLPAGWLGKCWACWQGYLVARGDLLLFTDADTRHDDELLGQAVGALQNERADLLSIMPRPLIESFSERLVRPQIMVILALRYGDFRRINRTADPLHAIANGQFLLFRRDAYETIGGHQAVRRSVTEDLALAQRVVSAGRHLFLAHAEELMDTRVYRSFAALLEGWSRTLAFGFRQTVSRPLRPAFPWLIGLAAILFWCAPPAIFIAALFGHVRGTAVGWSLITTAVSIVFWMATNYRFRIPLLHALLYPVGALITGMLFFRSALRGGRIAWRGRTYLLRTSTGEGD